MEKFISFDEIKKSLEKKETDCHAIVSHYLQNIKTKAHLNAFVEVYEESALQQADLVDQKLSEGKAGKLAGMVIGMGVLMLALLLFSSFSAAFEIFPVGMAITMPVGMAAGMAVAAAGPNLICTLSAAAVFSLFSQLGFDLYNMKLQGDVRIEK